MGEQRITTKRMISRDSFRILKNSLPPRPRWGFLISRGKAVALSDVVADGTFWRPRPSPGAGGGGDALFWSVGEVGDASSPSAIEGPKVDTCVETVGLPSGPRQLLGQYFSLLSQTDWISPPTSSP